MAQIKTNLQYGVTGSLQTASYSSLDATKLSGNLPALNASALTTLNASNVSSGTLNAARYSGGKILQCIQTAGKGAISTTSTSYVTSGLEVIITPSATSSKILVMLNGGTFDNASNSRMRCAMYYKVTSGGTYALATIYTSAAESHHEMVYCPSERGGPHSLSILHAPSSTSELYYAPFYKTDSGTGFFNNESAMGINLIAMEIGA